MNGLVRKIVSILLLLVIAGLVYANIKSIMQPINFNKQKDYRESVGIQRMKDLRTLQEAYKAVNGKFTSSADSLADFYKNGQMEILMQIGSNDDSLAVVRTLQKRRETRILYLQQDQCKGHIVPLKKRLQHRFIEIYSILKW